MVCPAVPTELGAQRIFFLGGGRDAKKNFFRLCPQLQNRVGAYGLEAEPPAGPGALIRGSSVLKQKAFWWLYMNELMNE